MGVQRSYRCDNFNAILLVILSFVFPLIWYELSIIDKIKWVSKKTASDSQRTVLLVVDRGGWILGSGIYSIFIQLHSNSHIFIHPFLSLSLSCSCLLKNMEGKCQVCHFSLSHPLSSFVPASASFFVLPVHLSSYYTFLQSFLYLVSHVVYRFSYVSLLLSIFP